MGDTQLDSVSADTGARLGKAVETFLRRESRSESPFGEWQEGVWRPAPEEQKTCCGGIAPAPLEKYRSIERIGLEGAG